MQGRVFYNNVRDHEGLEWLGVHEGDDPLQSEAIVLDNASGIKHAISLSSILEHTWDELEGVVTGKRDARVMIHLTRIVGYYSRVQNWNRSKLAELRDRHKGDYAPEEPKVAEAKKAPAPVKSAPVYTERMAVPA